MHSLRAQMRCLASFGPIFVLISSPFPNVAHSSCIRTYIYNKTFVSQKKMKAKKGTYLAQMTYLVLFGPIFVFAGSPFPYSLHIRT